MGDQVAARVDRGDDCPELDCVRHMVSPTALSWAVRRAERLGIGADRALIAARLIDEEAYVRALGKALDIAFEPLDGTPRAACPLDAQALIAKVPDGLLPLTYGDDAPLCLVVAPTRNAARGLVRMVRNDPEMAGRFRLTTGARLTRFVMRAGQPALVETATVGLRSRWPEMSAAQRADGLKLGFLAALALSVIATAPAITMPLLELILSAIFMACLGLRLTGASLSPCAVPARDMPDAALPIYTIIAALYREALSVTGLIAAIERLDYPTEKLDVIVAVEADDRDTRAALDALKPRVPLTIIAVPPGQPRTKPKALNVALPFARGTYTVIYDAEDRPEPDQLRKALQAFVAGPADLACVQARLCIDNTDDNWLARYFTAEYAGQFDVFLPGMARLGVPLPLGGSSNHFRTETLREVGAWDPHNVTEDADLGIRLARFGYRTSMIASTTYEEAPATFGPWLRQRTRWFKGWMQTWMVHMREPGKLWRQLGPGGFTVFQLLLGGQTLAALMHPLFVAGLIYTLLRIGTVPTGDGPSPIALGSLYGAAVLAGYLITALLGWIGLARRGLSSSARVLLLTPLQWLLLSCAAWRALYQLCAAPFMWEKTDHGIARTSRRATREAETLANLDRNLRQAKADGKLPEVNAPIQENAPPLRASA